LTHAAGQLTHGADDRDHAEHRWTQATDQSRQGVSEILCLGWIDYASPVNRSPYRIAKWFIASHQAVAGVHAAHDLRQPADEVAVAGWPRGCQEFRVWGIA
jgi:hypothetical protein